MMVVMVMAFLFTVMVLASRFRVHFRDNHFAFVAHHFTVACPVAGIVERLLPRRLAMMVVVALAALLICRIAQVVPGLAVGLA